MRLKFKCMSRAPEIDDPDLAHLTRLIRHPLIGLFYRRRFQAVLDLCDTPVDRALEISYGVGFLPAFWRRRRGSTSPLTSTLRAKRQPSPWPRRGSATFHAGPATQGALTVSKTIRSTLPSR